MRSRIPSTRSCCSPACLFVCLGVCVCVCVCVCVICLFVCFFVCSYFWFQHEKVETRFFKFLTIPANHLGSVFLNIFVSNRRQQFRRQTRRRCRWNICDVCWISFRMTSSVVQKTPKPARQEGAIKNKIKYKAVLEHLALALALNHSLLPNKVPTHYK